jgi:thiol-disulfide isomerase/thioredoxin
MGAILGLHTLDKAVEGSAAMRPGFAIPVAFFLFFWSLSTAPSLFAQALPFVVEPKCPVSGTVDEDTKELRITYFPASPGAAIKSPQRPVLEVGVNGPYWQDNAASAPFTRNASGTWQATLVRGEKEHWVYLMFQVKDVATGQIDDHGRQYWDVVPCYDSGERNSQGVAEQARSYTGYRFDNGMGREQDYANAVAILDNFMKQPGKERYSLIHDYWDYRVKQSGNDAAAWTKVSVEIGRFIDDHHLEIEALDGVSSFVVINEKFLPSPIYPRLMSAIEKLDPDRAAKIDRWAALTRIRREKDSRQKADDLGEFIRKYPNEAGTPLAAVQRMSLLRNLHDVDAAALLFPQLLQFDAGRADTYATMAAIYIDNGQNVDEALKLLDRAQQLGKSGVESGASRIPSYLVLSPDPAQAAARLSYWRARAYLQQGKGQLAVPLAQKTLEQQKSSANYFLMAQAYEAVGEKQKAVDSYIEAISHPSQDASLERERLEHLWVSGGFGTKEALDQKLQARRGQQFSQNEYVPRLVDSPVNKYDFTTIKGEKFSSADLRDKTVILNFWATWCSPCLPELPGFQDLQDKHPELVVATLAISSEREQIDRLVQNKKLGALRIAEVPDSLSQAFVPQGVPITYVIDHDHIRVIHRQPLSDVVGYIEADLAAIEKEAMPVAHAARP